MPHREVIREESLNTKLRVVFDASSHTQGLPSLNECLDKRENLYPELLQVLIRFRWYPIACKSDIKKAFLQIEIQELDRDAYRFLWFDTVPGSQTNNIVEWRMTQVPFGSTSSPFLLMATIHHHLDTVSEEDKTLASILKKAFYVDYLLVGAVTFEEGLDIYKRSKTIMNDAGMNLRKWKTNDKRLQEVFDRNEEQVESAQKTSVLGMHWDPVNDLFEFSANPLLRYINQTQGYTKRTLLKTASIIFDPLGIVSPFTVTAKLLFQRLWVLKSPWDEKLPEEIKKQWKEWCADAILLTSVTISRCVKAGLEAEIDTAELHIFSYASLKAYEACAYLRTVDIRGNTVTLLIAAK